MAVYLLKAEDDAGALVEIERRLKAVIPDIKWATGVEEIGKPSLRGLGRSIAILLAPSTDEDLAGLIDVVSKRVMS